MVFSSITFLFIFLPIVLIIYHIISNKFKNLFLTIASLFFYAWGEKRLVMLMIFSIVINYLGGLVIDKMNKVDKSKISKWYLSLFVSINILILGYYKYTNFFIDTINDVSNSKIAHLEEIILPIGISFFTFQGMSYLIDVYYKKVSAQKDLTSLALYISMFPQLIAGPIVRYIDVSKEIEAVKVFKISQFQEGVKRFIIGLFKKVIIANQVGFIADAVFADSAIVGSMALWIGIICYAFQIYFDFSGYSDMAIGLGKMFGFNFLENFNIPYISKSIQEFWRRWHISLSSWFRDYLYIPLGGSRKGVSRTYFNLFLVFLITGLWHGSNWTFVFWGLFHGFFLILERIWLGKRLEALPKGIGHIYTLLVVLIGWVFFRSDSIGEAFQYIGGMFAFKTGDNAIVYQHINIYFLFVFILAVLFSTKIKGFVETTISKVLNEKWRSLMVFPAYIFVFLVCILELAQSNYNPFIYFRF